MHEAMMAMPAGRRVISGQASTRMPNVQAAFASGPFPLYATGVDGQEPNAHRACRGASTATLAQAVLFVVTSEQQSSRRHRRNGNEQSGPVLPHTTNRSECVVATRLVGVPAPALYRERQLAGRLPARPSRCHCAERGSNSGSLNRTICVDPLASITSMLIKLRPSLSINTLEG